MRWLVVVLAFSGCAKEVRTVQVQTWRWVWGSPKGRQCIFNCRSLFYSCNSKCGRTTVVGPNWAAAIGGPRGCTPNCQQAAHECLKGCPDAELVSKKMPLELKCPYAAGCTNWFDEETKRQAQFLPPGPRRR